MFFLKLHDFFFKIGFQGLMGVLWDIASVNIDISNIRDISYIITVGGADMINKTFISNGKNEFSNYVFSSSEWSAPTMVSVEEIKNQINSFHLVGRKIKELRLIGLSYFLTRDYIENSAYNALPEDMSEEERQHKSEYDIINPALEISRHSVIDEPFLIKFEDKETFEIDTPQVPEYRFSMNCIPWFIDSGTNDPNVEANILFEPCIGKEIVEVAVAFFFLRASGKI